MKNIFSLFLVSFLCITLHAQENNIPALQLSYSDDFSAYRSQPAMCVSDIHEDSSGKLWLTSCGGAAQLSAHLFSFDGYKFELDPGNLSHLGNSVNISGAIGDILYGIVRTSDEIHIFKMNLINKEFKYLDTLPTAFNAPLQIEQQKIYHVNIVDKQIKVDIRIGDNLDRKTIDAKDKFGIDNIAIQYVLIRDYHLWVWDSKYSKFHILNLKNNVITQLDLSEYLKTYNLSSQGNKSLSFSFTGNILHLTFGDENNYYVRSFQLSSNREILIAKKNEIKSRNRPLVFKDHKSQLLYLYEENTGIKAFVELKEGIKIDASDLFTNKKVRDIRNVISADFTNQFYLCESSGITINKVKINNAIIGIPTSSSLRSIVEYPDNKLLINSQRSNQYLYDLESGILSEYSNSQCSFTSRVLRVEGSSIWSSNKNDFLKYDPVSNRCVNYVTNSKSIKNFEVLSNGKIIYVSDRNINLFNPKTGEKLQFKSANSDENFVFNTIIHDIFIDSKIVSG